jgi:hypothetical protein
MYKALFVILLSVFDACFAFSYIPKNINRITNNNISLYNKKGVIRHPVSPQGYPFSPAADITSPHINRSVLGLLLGVIPTIPLKYIIARNTKPTRTNEEPLDDIIELAAMATLGSQDILATTTQQPCLPLLDDEANYTYGNNTVSTKTKAKIEVIVDNIMKNCKKNGKNTPEAAIRNLQKYCSPTNVIKNKNAKALVFCFRKCKYSLLLGDFSNYETIGYTKHTDEATNNRYYYVDIKVSAPYKTMLRNGIQFNDMYYPKLRDYNNTCYVIYKLSFKDYEDGSLYIEGHTLVPPRTQI